MESATSLTHILRIYEECSGQCVNGEKISIYFSPNTPHYYKIGIGRVRLVPLRVGLVSLYIGGIQGYKYNTYTIQTLYIITFITPETREMLKLFMGITVEAFSERYFGASNSCWPHYQWYF
jgi:hypothetical protein